jgi:hypothetical protein
MKKIFLTIAIFYVASHIFAQNPIHILRYNDNFHYLKNDTITKRGLDKLKMIPIGTNDVFLSVGGEVREQLQYFDNQNFGDVPPVFESVDATQLWHRIMVHADLELGKKWRLFTQLNNTFRLFNPNPAIEIDENALGWHQAFAEFRPNKSLSFRVGRQELGYGNNRMLTFREGPNNRLAFDAAVAKWHRKNWRIDALVAFPVFQKTGIGDDVDFQDRVMGLYATHTVVPKKLMVDYYSLYFEGNRIKYNLQGGREKRQSFGLRAFSHNPRFNYELEGTYQVGFFNGLDINAFAIAYDLKYRFFDKRKLTLGVAGNYISGDHNPTDNILTTYNLLFSKPSFGLAAPIGASNIVNTNPYIQFNPTPKLQVLGSVYFLSKQTSDDGVYSPGMVQTRPVRQELLYTSSELNLGQQYAFEVSFFHNQHWAFFADVAYFKAGQFVKATGNGDNITYVSAKTAYKF